MSSERNITINENSKSMSFITIVLVSLLVDILLISEISDVFIFFLLTFYIMGVLFFRIKSKWSLYISLFLCILMSIFYVFNNLEIADKTAAWLFLFLLTGVVQELLNEKI